MITVMIITITFVASLAVCLAAVRMLPKELRLTGYDCVPPDELCYLSTARFNIVCVDLAPTRRLIESPSA